MKKSLSSVLAFTMLASWVLSCGCSLGGNKTVKFGSYEGEAISWIVLDYEDGTNLLLSEKILDVLPYNYSEANGIEDPVWENCTLRDWLNGNFYSEAFSAAEQEKIVTSKVINSDNPNSGKPGGRDTEDKVFLLSVEEVEQYFEGDAQRAADSTKYVKKNYSIGSNNHYQWWLRTTGEYTGWASYVNYNGSVFSSGEDAGTGVSISNSTGDGRCYGVRPAVRVKLDKPVEVPHRDITVTEYTGEPVENYASYIEDHELVEFGYFGGEEIQWMVIDEKDGYTLLLSHFVLAGMPFNDKDEDTTWENCSLRKWLNEDFYNEAFNAEEQAKIKTTTVTTGDNPEYGTSGGKYTQDKVFLFSAEEAYSTYDLMKDQITYGTLYAMENGVQMDAYNYSPWWLRSPGSDSRTMQIVRGYGDSPSEAHACSADNYGVRPAIWVDLSAENDDAPVIDLSASEYLVEMPIESDKDIYIKFPPHLRCSVASTTLFMSEENMEFMSDPCACFTMADKTSFTLDFYEEHAENGYEVGDNENIYYKIHDPETGANGCKIYKIDQTYTWMAASDPFYLIIWKIDDKNTVIVQLYSFGSPEHENYYGEELEDVLDFYRTDEKAFVAVDRGTRVNKLP